MAKGYCSGCDTLKDTDNATLGKPFLCDPCRKALEVGRRKVDIEELKCHEVIAAVKELLADVTPWLGDDGWVVDRDLIDNLREAYKKFSEKN